MDLKGCVLSDPDPWIIEEAVEVHVGGDSLPVQSPVLRSVDCSPGLYQSLRGGVGLAHARGIRLLRYLDDWLVLSSSEKKAKESIRELLSLCRTLGIVINEKKLDLVPSQSAKYLGMTIDTGAGKVFLSLARVEKFLTVAERFCSMQSPPAQLWQVILGHLASLERLVPSRSTSDALLAVASEVPVVPRVRPSLASGGFAGGSETGPVLVDGEGSPVSGGSIRGHLLRIYTCIRTRLRRVGVLTSSIKTCPGCGPPRRSCCTSIFSK